MTKRRNGRSRRRAGGGGGSTVGAIAALAVVALVGVYVGCSQSDAPATRRPTGKNAVLDEADVRDSSGARVKEEPMNAEAAVASVKAGSASAPRPDAGAAALPRGEENIVFPDDAGLVDVTGPPYEMKGDGVTDNTEALRRAFLDNRGRNRTLYFPDGVYLVGDRVNISGDEPSKAHSPHRFLHLQGQSERGAVLRLKDNAPRYDDPDRPKTFISLYEGKSTGDAMHTYVRNLTVEVGRGNPGAAALRYLTNNTGSMYDVTIRSLDPEKRGAVGLDLRQSQNGPGLIKRVTVEGFDYGVQTANTFSLVLEHITVRGQRKAGFNAGNSRLTMRDYRSANSVPALVGSKHTHLTLVEAALTGGAGGETAIRMVSDKLYVRDVKVDGYAHTIETKNGTFVDGALDEWYDGKGYALFGAEPKSLRLPVRETLEIPWQEDLSKWQKVEAGTDTLQAALDRAAAGGKTTVYLPRTRTKSDKYVITKPVRVHGSVNRIIGMENILWIDEAVPVGEEVIVFDELDGPVVVERFFNFLKHEGWKGLRDRYLFGNRSDHPVVIRNIAHGACELKKPHPGQTWFVEDVAGGIRVGEGERVWARQLNPESPERNMVEVDGGTLWYLGMKTEGRARHIVATNGAKVELLGGVAYQSWKNQKLDPPMFTVVDSEASFIIGFYHWRLPFTTIVEETRGGETRSLKRKELGTYHLHMYRAGK